MSMKIPKTVRQNEAYLSLRAREGEAGQLKRDKKSYCLVDECVLGPLETTGRRHDLVKWVLLGCSLSITSNRY